jgi:hypothetical protein
MNNICILSILIKKNQLRRPNCFYSLFDKKNDDFFLVYFGMHNNKTIIL